MFKKFTQLVSLLAFFLLLTGCSFTPKKSAYDIESEAIAAQCEIDKASPTLDPIRHSIPWNLPSTATQAMRQNRVPTPFEREVLEEMIVLYSKCEGRAAAQLYVDFRTAGAASFSSRVNQEIEVFELLTAGRLTIFDANRYRYRIAQGQFQTIMQDDLRRAQLYQQQQATQFQERLRDQQRLFNEQNNRQNSTTNTQCWPDGSGGFHCRSISN